MLSLGTNGAIFLAEQAGIPIRKGLDVVVTPIQLLVYGQACYARALDVAHMNAMPTFIAGNYAKISTRLKVPRTRPTLRSIA